MAEVKQSTLLKGAEGRKEDIKNRKSLTGIELRTLYRDKVTNTLTAKKIKTIDDKTSLYEVCLDLETENVGDRPFEISYWVADYYIGTIPENVLDKPEFVVELGVPADRWNPRNTRPGAVEWHKEGTVGAILAVMPAKDIDPLMISAKDSMLSGGNMTG